MANPHLVQYLQQLQSSSTGKIACSFSKAIKSLNLYPLPIRSGKEALILEGVGKTIADHLDNYFLQKHPSFTPSTIPSHSPPSSLSPISPPITTPISSSTTIPLHDSTNNLNANNSRPQKTTTITKSNQTKTPDIIILDSDSDDDAPVYSPPSPQVNTVDSVDIQSNVYSKTYSPRYGSPPWALLIALAQHHQVKPKLPILKSSLLENASRLSAVTEVVLNIIRSKGLLEFDETQCLLTPLGIQVALSLYQEYISDKENIDSICFVSPRSTPVKKSKTSHRFPLQDESDDLCRQFSLMQSPSKPPPPRVSTASTTTSSTTVRRALNPPAMHAQPSQVATTDKPDMTPSVVMGTAITVDQIPIFSELVLILDNREVRTKKDRDYMHNKLTSMGINAEVRTLAVGDAMWIARDANAEEWVLDYIVERKKVDDLCSSIIDGRYYEQKFRLAKCGCTRKIYMVEGRIAANYTGSIPPDTLESALASTQVQDNTIVKQTLTIDETVQYLATMTIRFTKLLPTTHSLILGGGKYRCSFAEFCASNSKNGNLPLSDLFAKQLMQIPGISGEKASAISSIYPSPIQLINKYNKVSKEEGLEMLANVKCGKSKRKLGSILAREVHLLYSSDHYT